MAREPLTEEQVVADSFTLSVATVGLSEEQFFQLCRDNPELHLELTARKELVIMTLPGPKTGRRNSDICYWLTDWSKKTGNGVTFTPLTLFVLPNGAMRAPDASWVRLERWTAFTDEQQESGHFCPDFVVELMSRSDRRRLKMLQSKMAEYVANGAQLGWLIDPFQKNVYIYRPDESPECLESPDTIEGDPVLPGFVFKVSEIWL